MKYGSLTSHTLLELKVDWFNECCFSIVTLNIQKHKKKFWFEIGLAGLTILFILDYSRDLLKDINEKDISQRQF